MRKLWILLAVLFTTSLITATGVDAAVKCKTFVRKHKVTVCHRMKKKAKMARAARGPKVTCPAPVVNCPAPPAPIVNVPQQPAPVVNVPPSPTPVGVATDTTSIYVLRGDTLTIIDKSNCQCIKTLPLPPVGAAPAGP